MKCSAFHTKHSEHSMRNMVAWRDSTGFTADSGGYLSVGPIEKIYDILCYLGVREKDWCAASPAFERTHNTLSHRPKT